MISLNPTYHHVVGFEVFHLVKFEDMANSNYVVSYVGKKFTL
jgi:hypothetical protein